MNKTQPGYLVINQVYSSIYYDVDVILLCFSNKECFIPKDPITHYVHGFNQVSENTTHSPLPKPNITPITYLIVLTRGYPPVPKETNYNGTHGTFPRSLKKIHTFTLFSLHPGLSTVSSLYFLPQFHKSIQLVNCFRQNKTKNKRVQQKVTNRRKETGRGLSLL